MQNMNFQSVRIGRLRPLAILIMVSLMVACRPQSASNFQVEDWSGQTLEGEQIRFADLDSHGVVLNVYSPTCGPCIEEIPALNAIYARARATGVRMYMIVENNPFALGIFPEDEGGVDARAMEDPEQRRSIVRQRLQRDVNAYGIQVPIVIMDAPFTLSQKDSLVTATPETLFLTTNPLILRFNMIGPVSTRSNADDLAADTRMQFALSQLDRLSSDTADAEAGGGYN